MQEKILVVGSSNTDMVIKAAKFPFSGQTIFGGKFFMNLEGKGADQVVTSEPALAEKRSVKDAVFCRSSSSNSSCAHASTRRHTLSQRY